MPQIGVVAIGRNEGERLRRCLESIGQRADAVVYVDSASTDGSVALAKSFGVDVVELDMALPFSAARARNAGVERLREIRPQVDFVQFVDGDCEVVAGWLERATKELEEHQDWAVVCGRRRERFPDASVYNRLCDIEWDTPVGEAGACGGDSLMRVAAFQKVGGFNPSVSAGEEPELCSRLRAAGWKIFRLDAEMTLHDAAMTQFRQFWRRTIRTGWGTLDVCARFPPGRPLFGKIVISTWIWTLGVVLVAGLVGWFVEWWVGLLVLLVWPLQIARIAMKERRRLGTKLALAHGWLTMIGKWAQLRGHLRYALDRILGRRQELIEYKSLGDPDWQADKARYPRRPFLKEQSIWAVWVYRFGRRVDRRKRGVRKWFLGRLYWLLYRFVETLTGVSIPKSAQIGPGLRIWHFGNIFVNARAVIGANCTLRQGVTIGDRVPDGPVPVLEDDVELGAYAQVLGGIRIGKGAKIGAMSVVLLDVPAGATAVGIPARILAGKPK